MKSVKKLREPGKRFEYSSMNTMMMIMLAEQITGQPFHDILTERVWSKAGMEPAEPALSGVVRSVLS
jgi:CubicO group peptidase (beta-lactamase class C family)